MYDELLEKYIKLYQNLIFSVCKRFIEDSQECENIVQDTYLSYFLKIGDYKDLTEEEIKNLLCKIALNKCKNYLKSAYVRKVEKELLIDDIECEESFEEQVSSFEDKKIIFNYLNRLEEPYRTLIYEYFFEDYTLDYLAKKHKRKKSVIKTQIYRGKQILKREILKDGGVTYEEFKG